MTWRADNTSDSIHGHFEQPVYTEPRCETCKCVLCCCPPPAADPTLEGAK